MHVVLLLSAWFRVVEPVWFVGMSSCVALCLVYQWARDWACISDASEWRIEGSWVFLQCAFYLLVVSLERNLPTRIWSVGIFLLKEGCFQVLCRDSCQNTVTVSETLNIATSLVTSLQVCRYTVYDIQGSYVQSWSSYIIMQLSCVSLLTITLVFVLCPCCIICAFTKYI